MVLYWWSNLGILKPCTNIQWLKRFYLGLWQISKQTYRKLQYIEKKFGKFQGWTRFLRKMVLYLLAKFDIVPIFSDSEDSIQAFCRLQSKFIGNANMSRYLLESLNLTFPEEHFCTHQPNFTFLNLAPIHI